MPDNDGPVARLAPVALRARRCSSLLAVGPARRARVRVAAPTSARALRDPGRGPRPGRRLGRVGRRAAGRGRRRRLVRLPRRRLGRQRRLGHLRRLRDARRRGDSERLRRGLDDLDLRRRGHRRHRHGQVEGLARTRRARRRDSGGSVVTGLVVQGQAVAPAPARSSRSATGATVVTLQQGTARSTTTARPGRARSSPALQVTLTVDHYGLPAGTEIMVGYAEAAREGDDRSRSRRRHAQPQPTKPPAEADEAPCRSTRPRRRASRPRSRA